MDLVNLLLTEIEKVSETEFKYKLIDLDSLTPFVICDKWIMREHWTKPRATRFLKDICSDNGKSVLNDSVISYNRICPLYFQGVFLKTNDNNYPMTANDIAIIPNVKARGLNRIASNICGFWGSYVEINGER